MPDVRRRLPCGARVVVLVLLAAVSSEAAPAVRQVLVLQSFDRGVLALDQFTANFRVDLDQRIGEPVNFVQFVVAPAGFITPPEEPVVDFLRSAFADRPAPDLIVTVGGPAAALARKHPRTLFPGTPRLFAAVDQRFLQGAPLAGNETAAAVMNDIPRLVDDILHLFPRTTQVFVVTGTGPVGRFWSRELEREFQRFHGRLTFVWSDELSFMEILRRVATLPPGSAILYVSVVTDALGGAYADERALAEIHARANAPLFGSQSALLGHGIVGGMLMSTDELGGRAADVAVRLLNGESPGTIRVPSQPAGPRIFDGRELNRWGIGEDRLPEGSIVRFRSPSLWRDHRGKIIGALAGLLLQTLLIVGLLYQRRARHRAEVDSRRSLAMAADANRRVTMSALTGSIAHELSQPLNAILHNARAGEMLVASRRATPETLAEILADIRAADLQATQIIERHRAMLRNRPLDKRPVDIHAVVRESLGLVAHESRSRRIQIAVDLPLQPCLVIGDSVLLQQVLVNLMMNAIEAMAESPLDRRRLLVRDHVRPDGVEISVQDTGPGLPEPVDGQLFEPFVTTKTNGLGIGLTIARNIVEAHGGRMEARNNPEGGATFKFMLPRPAGHRSQA
jgi:signal transduction histidine kinase